MFAKLKTGIQTNLQYTCMRAHCVHPAAFTCQPAVQRLSYCIADIWQSVGISLHPPITSPYVLLAATKTAVAAMAQYMLLDSSEHMVQQIINALNTKTMLEPLLSNCSVNPT